MTTTTTTRISTARAHAVLPAEDLARARRFWGETLGFVIEEMPESSQFLVHAGGDTRILVYERARTVAEHTAAELLVDDLRATVEEMRSRGIVFEEYDLPGLKTVDGIVDMGGQAAAWFTDPEGNIISVAEME